MVLIVDENPAEHVAERKSAGALSREGWRGTSGGAADGCRALEEASKEDRRPPEMKCKNCTAGECCGRQCIRHSDILDRCIHAGGGGRIVWLYGPKIRHPPRERVNTPPINRATLRVRPVRVQRPTGKQQGKKQPAAGEAQFNNDDGVSIRTHSSGGAIVLHNNGKMYCVTICEGMKGMTGTNPVTVKATIQSGSGGVSAELASSLRRGRLARNSVRYNTIANARECIYALCASVHRHALYDWSESTEGSRGLH
ncbi:hypothetical protein EVAR_48739_1 [Eumeta japonica]|uniref:Uncharacterized protein n=1 Tax=Eumeta variegata TaxID=151549 RepID=A0A4C1YKA4_EUMVA|nr:hypothetical protein EVAR_48739_1 [Eumeta japonica]